MVYEAMVKVVSSYPIKASAGIDVLHALQWRWAAIGSERAIFRFYKSGVRALKRTQAIK